MAESKRVAPAPNYTVDAACDFVRRLTAESPSLVVADLSAVDDVELYCDALGTEMLRDDANMAHLVGVDLPQGARARDYPAAMLARANAYPSPLLVFYLRTLVAAAHFRAEFPDTVVPREVLLDEGRSTHRYFDDDAVGDLVELLVSLEPADARRIRTLSVAGNFNSVTSAGVDHVCRFLSDRSRCALTRLDFSDTNIGHLGITKLAMAFEEAGSACTIEDLGLANCGMTGKGCTVIASTISNAPAVLLPALSSLSLERNDLSQAACIEVARCARLHPMLSTLILKKGNDCRGSDVLELLELQSLEAKFGLDQATVSQLRAVHRNAPSVTTLRVGGPMPDAAAPGHAAALVLPATPASYQLICHAVRGNSCITHFHFESPALPRPREASGDDEPQGSQSTRALIAEHIALVQQVLSAVGNTLEDVRLDCSAVPDANWELLNIVHDASLPALKTLVIPFRENANSAGRWAPLARTLCLRCPALTDLQLQAGADERSTGNNQADSMLLLETVEFGAKSRADLVVGPHVDKHVLRPTSDSVPEELTIDLYPWRTTLAAIERLENLYRNLLPRTISAVVTDVILVFHGDLYEEHSESAFDAPVWTALAERLLKSFDASSQAASASLLPMLRGVTLTHKATGAGRRVATDRAVGLALVDTLRRLFSERHGLLTFQHNVDGTELPGGCPLAQGLAGVEEVATCNQGSPVFRRVTAVLRDPTGDNVHLAFTPMDGEGRLDRQMITLLTRKWTAAAAAHISSVDFSHIDLGNAHLGAFVNSITSSDHHVTRFSARNASLDWADNTLLHTVEKLLSSKEWIVERLDVRDNVGLTADVVRALTRLVGLKEPAHTVTDLRCTITGADPDASLDEAVFALDGALALNRCFVVKDTLRELVAADSPPAYLDLELSNAALGDAGLASVAEVFLTDLNAGNSTVFWRKLGAANVDVRTSVGADALLSIAAYFSDADLSSNRTLRPKDLVEAFKRHVPAVGCLRSLNLQNCEALWGTDEASAMVAAIAAAPRVLEVHCLGTGWSVEDQSRLERTAHLNRMQSIPDAVRRLTQPDIHLQHVFITEPLDDVGLDALCVGVAASPFIRTMSACGGGTVSRRALQALCDCITSPSACVEAVSLPFCGIGDKHAFTLATMLAKNPPTLRCLDVRSDLFDWERFAHPEDWPAAIAAASRRLADVVGGPTLMEAMEGDGGDSPSRRLFWTPEPSRGAGALATRDVRRSKPSATTAEGGVIVQATSPTDSAADAAEIDEQNSLAAVMGALTYFNHNLRQFRVLPDESARGLAPMSERARAVVRSFGRACRRNEHSTTVKRTLAAVEHNLPAVHVIDWSNTNVSDGSLQLLTETLWDAYTALAREVTQLDDAHNTPAMPLITTVNFENNDAVTDAGLFPFLECLRDIEDRRMDGALSSLRYLKLRGVGVGDAGQLSTQVGDALCRILRQCPNLHVELDGTAVPNALDVHLHNACNLQPPRFRTLLLEFEAHPPSRTLVYEPLEEEVPDAQQQQHQASRGLVPVRPSSCASSPRGARTASAATSPTYAPGSARRSVARSSSAFSRTGATPGLRSGPTRQRGAVGRNMQLNDLSCELLADRFLGTAAGRATHLARLALTNSAIASPGVQALAQMVSMGSHPLVALDLSGNAIESDALPYIRDIVLGCRSTLSVVDLGHNLLTDAVEQPLIELIRDVAQEGRLTRFEVASNAGLMPPDAAARIQCAAALGSRSAFVRGVGWTMLDADSVEVDVLRAQLRRFHFHGETFTPSSVPLLIALGILTSAFRFAGLAAVDLAEAGITDADFDSLPFASCVIWRSFGEMLVHLVTSSPRLTSVDVSRNHLSCSATLVPLIDAARTHGSLNHLDMSHNKPRLSLVDAIDAEVLAAEDLLSLAATSCTNAAEGLKVHVGPFEYLSEQQQPQVDDADGTATADARASPSTSLLLTTDSIDALLGANPPSNLTCHRPANQTVAADAAVADAAPGNQSRAEHRSVD